MEDDNEGKERVINNDDGGEYPSDILVPGFRSPGDCISYRPTFENEFESPATHVD